MAVVSVIEVTVGGEVIWGAVTSLVVPLTTLISVEGLLSVVLVSAPFPDGSVELTRR